MFREENTARSKQRNRISRFGGKWNSQRGEKLAASAERKDAEEKKKLAVPVELWCWPRAWSSLALLFDLPLPLFLFSFSLFFFFRESGWLDGCGPLPRLHLPDSRIGEFVAWRNCQTRRQPTQPGETEPKKRIEIQSIMFHRRGSIQSENTLAPNCDSVVFCRFDPL